MRPAPPLDDRIGGRAGDQIDDARRAGEAKVGEAFRCCGHRDDRAVLTRQISRRLGTALDDEHTAPRSVRPQAL
jgi:hypothetical protein